MEKRMKNCHSQLRIYSSYSFILVPVLVLLNVILQEHEGEESNTRDIIENLYDSEIP